MKKHSLGILFSIVFMDMIGFGFIIPLLPDYISTFGGPAWAVGLLMAAYAAGQFIAAPIVGRLSDRFGRRPLLALSIGGTFLSLLLLGSASSLVIVFVSRILDGLTGGNITVAQAYISDITTAKNRAKGLGLIGMAFGLGFIFGPVFGGLLVVFGLGVPAFVAAGFALINLLLILFLLPESLSEEIRAERTSAELRAKRGFSLGALRETLSDPKVGKLLMLSMVYTFAFYIFETVFSLHAQTVLNLQAQTRSFILAYTGVLIALVQGGGIGMLTRRFSEPTLFKAAALVLAPSLLLWGLSGSIIWLMIVLIPLSFSSAVASVMLRSMISKSVPPEKTGGTLGLAASIDSMNRILAPLVGAFLLTGMGAWVPGAAAAILVFVVSQAAHFVMKDAKTEIPVTAEG